ncbi:hypothetical protein Ait01nite_010910 [Actinoplanes italicus]|uniref:Universal stress protein family protein n=1 Tax=Actinoplanes italicus TaxID=113567 RepID=A0A2T0KGG7_9ACTN|nr:hypothetical protein [Actinoplanes italicus]PRX22530.1 hypothetical protein CLV67_10457 [Actinoplanes italicus]GIE28046.1 hypothetical protein Ait01nite_010910 [Actinoplanes italicus]
MSETKTAVVILSDPTPDTEESLARVFNALAAAWEYGRNGEALVLLQGAGTRRPERLRDTTHPAPPGWRACGS